MRNLLNYFNYLPKRILSVFIIAVLIAIPFAASAGWAPERPIKDWNNPADRVGFDHVVFNSFINVPGIGDERGFHDAKDAANTGLGGFQDTVNVGNDGQELLLRTYVHNNANQSLNESGQGVAHNTNVRILIPTGTDRALRTISYVSASNASPGTVSDTVDYVNEVPFSLEYIPGSAVAYTNAVPNGYQVADSIVNSGAPVGYTGPNGEMPGCFEFTAIVTIKVKVKVADFTVQKQVRKDGEKEWKESVTVNPGDKVEYLITFKNNSKVTLNNIAVQDKLPAHVTYVTGTTRYANSDFPQGKAAGTDSVVSNGINLGSNYQPDSNAFVTFKAQVDTVDKLECGKNVLRNKAIVQPEEVPSKEDTADVIVEKPCQPPQPPCEVNCVPPVTPQPSQPLPNTGPAETAAAGIVGSGGLGVAIRGYIRSRKNLAKALIS